MFDKPTTGKNHYFRPASTVRTVFRQSARTADFSITKNFQNRRTFLKKLIRLPRKLVHSSPLSVKLTAWFYIMFISVLF